jgi:hypothetical protein
MGTATAATQPSSIDAMANRPLRLVGRQFLPERVITVDHFGSVMIKQTINLLEDVETGERFYQGDMVRMKIGGLPEFYEGNWSYCIWRMQQLLKDAAVGETTRAIIRSFLDMTQGGARGEQGVDQSGPARR